MAEQKTFYITTPIYYVNGVPHVGSATTTLLCDAAARYYRQQGRPVHFLTGTDEHAQKVADAAVKAGKTPQEFVDEVSQRFVETWRFLQISQDDFIRTSEPRHKAIVAEVFERLKARGEIYAGQYEGWYSVADETFFRDSEVKDGRAIESGAVVERVTEDVYYFRLSAYGDRLLSYIQENPDFLQPDTRRNEVISFIKEGLRDIAISRRNTGWGIEVPGDPSQVVYVWFDAVINYLSATGWPNAADWATLWPADVHLVGKEIYTRFHATLWPAMLMALDLPLPKLVIGHGWWLVGGQKGAKSKGNIPTPQEAVSHIVERSGATADVAIDALRYYLIKDISFTSDAEFSLETLAERYNFDLANDLGNLLNRTLNMLKQYRDGIVPEGAASRTQDSVLAVLAREVAQDVERAMLAFDPSAALTAIWKLVKAANKEIDTRAPWKLNKEGDAQGVADALYAALEANRIAAGLLAPFLPHTAALIRTQLGLDGAVVPPGSEAALWGLLPGGARTQEAQPIFPRINLKETKKNMTETITNTPEPKSTATAPPEAKPQAESAPASEHITIDDVAKLQLRVAEIKTAERIEGADKLLKLTIDVGEGADRSLIAGIAKSYAPEALPGRKIVVIANLQPRKMRGVLSQGMLLAATDADGSAVLLTPENANIAPGAEVR